MIRLSLYASTAAVLAAWGLAIAAQNPVKTLQRVDAKLAPAQVSSAPSPAPAPSPASSPARAEAPQGTGSVAPAPGGPPPEDNLLTEGEALYRHQTERDPFSPLVRSNQQGPEVKIKVGSTGLARFTVESCVLEAVLKTPAGTVAWFQGPDTKPYKASVGERFADGVVLNISYGSGEVTVQQELNDPTAIKPFRNLILRIRNLEGEGQ